MTAPVEITHMSQNGIGKQAVNLSQQTSFSSSMQHDNCIDKKTAAAALPKHFLLRGLIAQNMPWISKQKRSQLE